MLHTLFGKISLAVLLIFITLSALLVSSIDNSARLFQEEAAQKLNLKLASNIVKDSPLWLEDGVAAKAIADAFHMMMMLSPGTELYIVAADGTLLNYSDPDGHVVRTEIDMAPLHQFLKDSSMLPIVGDDPRSAATRKIFSVAPIYPAQLAPEQQQDTIPAAYLYIILGGLEYDSVISMLDSSHVARLGITTIAAGAVFFILVMLLLFFVLTRPIRKLAGGIAQFRELHYMQVPASLEDMPRGKDELAALCASVNEMAARIVSQFNTMIRNRNSRQELITHISHDLRTPLAGIRGYLESLQIRMRGQQDPDTSRYVEIALKSCDHMERMVEELFELSKLEANEISPDFETFPLDELVDDIIQKLSLKAAARNVQLLCQGPEQLPAVRADIGQINRVFTNLLDNAIRHSRANTQVIISLQPDEQNRVIRVEISDSGTGIPATEIPLLFEPYFRASNQDKHYEKGTGLGFAITRRLLQLHGSDIQVQSQEQVGTVFTFGIPCEQAAG